MLQRVERVRILSARGRWRRDSADRQARASLASYLAAAGVTLPILLDLDGSLHGRLGSGLPLTVVLDTSGRTVATYSGFEPGIAEKLRERVLALVDESEKRSPGTKK